MKAHFFLVLFLVFGGSLFAQKLIPLNQYEEEIADTTKMSPVFYKRITQVGELKYRDYIHTAELKLTSVVERLHDKKGNVTVAGRTDFNENGTPEKITITDFTEDVTHIEYFDGETKIREYWTGVKGRGFISGYKYNNGDTIAIERILESPDFGSPDDYKNLLRDYLTYPVESRRAGESGEVKVALHVSREGTLIRMEVANTEYVPKRLVNQSLRVLKKYKGTFQPALDFNGDPVDSYFIVPIRFVLN
jgi:hypothetical protein